MERLRAHDQLFSSRRRMSAFVEFEEPPLDFRPTYKFDSGTLDTYDTSEKQRVPAWCDRVLYRRAEKGGAGVQVNGYRSVESLRCSDHKPVIASFTVSVQQCEDHAAATQLRLQFEAVPPRKAASAAFPVSAVTASPRPQMRANSTGSGDSFTGAAVERAEASAAYSYVKQQMASFGLQGVGAIQWGGKGAWKPTHVQLMDSTLRLRGTGFAADTGPDAVVTIDLLGTETRRPTTVRKGHPYAFRIDLGGADRLKHSVTKILCDLNDELAVDQWIASLNQAANHPDAAAAAAPTAGELDGSINGGLDEDAAIRAAIALSSGIGSSAATRVHSDGDDDDDENAPALLRRRNYMQAGAQQQRMPPARDAPAFDIFGSTPHDVQTAYPEPEPERAYEPTQTAVQMDLQDFFGTGPTGGAAAKAPSAPADLFGMDPFSAVAATPTFGAAGAPHAPDAASGDLDLFGSEPFAGAPTTAPAPAPAANDAAPHDLLHGW